MFSKVIKKIYLVLAIVLGIGIFTTVIPVMAKTNDNEFKADGYTFVITKAPTEEKKGKVSIALYEDSSDRIDIVIPDVITYEGGEYSVTELQNGAFAGARYLENIKITNGLKTIGDACFYSCTSLKTVSIPGSVEKIGLYVFDNCSALESVTVSLVNPYYRVKNNILYNKEMTQIVSASYIDGDVIIVPTVEKINEGAFAHNDKVTTITLSDACKTIEAYAFYGCASLRRVDLCNCETIGEGAFRESAITELVIPKSLKKLTGNPFIFCDKLESISVSNKNKQFSSVNNVIYSKDGKRLILALIDDKSYTINKNVQEIESFAFAGNTTITELTIPKSVKIIHKGAFYNCTSLKKIHFASFKVNFPDETTETDGKNTYKCGAFFNIKPKTVVEVPYSDKSAYNDFEKQLKDNLPKNAKIISF